MNLLLLQKLRDNFMRFRLDRITGPFSRFFFKLDALTALSRWRARQQCSGPDDFYCRWDYGRRFSLHEFIIKKFELTGRPFNFIEFGVAEGESMQWWLDRCRHPDTLFLGLDSFEGLPEDWGIFKKGDMAFSSETLSLKDKRTRIVKGWFQDTVNPALEGLDHQRQNIVHLDADLFSSTLVALTQLFRFLKKDDILIFDEFSTPTHEFNAFRFFSESFYIRYETLAAASNYTFVAIRIL